MFIILLIYTYTGLVKPECYSMNRFLHSFVFLASFGLPSRRCGHLFKKIYPSTSKTHEISCKYRCVSPRRRQS